MKTLRIALLLAALAPSGTVAAQEFAIDETVAADREAVRLVQTQLTELGFSPGGADGAFGRRTQGAIEAFATRFPSDLTTGLTPDMAARIALVHDGRFGTAFAGDLLVRPTGFMPAPRVHTSDIRQETPECGACNITPMMLAAGDLDGDGRDEIVFGYHLGDANYDVVDVPTRLSILSYAAPDNRLPGFPDDALPSRVHEREAIIADFNGDGLGDLFVAAHGLDRQPFPGEQNVLILSGAEGHRDVSATHLPQLTDMAHGAAHGDLEGDGDLDMIIITNQGSARILPYVLRNDGAGQFTQEDISTILDPALVNMYGGPHRAEYSTARLADLNGDGAVDLLLLARGEDPGRVSRYSAGTRRSLLLYNDGNGQFPSETLVELPTDRWGYGTFTNDAEAIDLDGDGALDLILTQSTRDGSWRGHYLQILMQENGIFVDRSAERLWPQGYPAPLNRINFADKTVLVDIDNDGDLDLVTRSLGPAFRENPVEDGIVQIGLNDGTGHFDPVDPRWLTGGSGYRGRAPIAGEFDGNPGGDLASYELNGQFDDQADVTWGIHLRLHFPPG